jgi:hypothetical protein
LSATKKQLSNPFSTGGGGVIFETRVQAAFVILMLCGGVAPAMPRLPITKVKLQGKYAGFETDDFIVFVGTPGGESEYKLLAQIKHSLSITQKNDTFAKVIAAAWQDFRNPQIFQRERDHIALITGPLSALDIDATRQLLEHARHSASSSEFFEKNRLGKFVSNTQRTKLDAFKKHLNAANGADVPPDDCWSFLKCFHLLGYDLDIKSGVMLSLLHSMIGQLAGDRAEHAWLSVVDFVQSANLNAGTITLDTLPPEILRLFAPKPIHQQPTVLKVPMAMVPVSSVTVITPMPVSHPEVYVLAALLGEWNEANEADCQLISRISGSPFELWLRSAREVLLQSGSKIAFKDGHWSVTDRSMVVSEIAPNIFNEHLERFRKAAIEVLKEVDPKFEIPADKRMLASMRGKRMTFSRHARHGIAEGLAILGNLTLALTSCDYAKVENTIYGTVNEVLNNAGGLVWASLDDLLPFLAEASPNAFLEAVEVGLNANPCPFDEVFDQEESGIMGSTYISGLLWALETLAWLPEHLSRVVICLGDLAARDRGGTWSNRPSNSLATILLPWLPQTTATRSQQSAAVKALLLETPAVGWSLLLGLLPNANSFSSGARKPVWLKAIPDDWKEEITNQDYWHQVTIYAGFAIDLAVADRSKLPQLTERFADLPPISQEQLLLHLGSEQILSLPEQERLKIWSALVELISKHKRHSSAPWALPSNRLSEAVEVGNRIAPRAASMLYRRLFSNNDFDLLEGEGDDYEVQQSELQNRRLVAVKLIAGAGIKDVIEFVNVVESPWQVGLALGMAASDGSFDDALLPSMLDGDARLRDSFLFGFVSSRFQSSGMPWVEQLKTEEWSPSQIGQFLSLLPFTAEVWAVASTTLGDDESPYWHRTSADPYQTKGSLDIAVDKLLRYGRPYAAIRCLAKLPHAKLAIDSSRIVKALLDALQSEESTGQLDSYKIVELIKYLQEDDSADKEGVAKVEWAYLQLLDHGAEKRPQTLERRMANEPDYFLGVIRLAFRSKNDKQKVKLEPLENENENEKVIASQAYRLLNRWKTPPGLTSEGTFDADKLKTWLDNVKNKSAESGYFDIAMSMLGQVMTNAPADPSGLWIHQAAATALNGREMDAMRNGFRTQLFNSRGVYSPTAGAGERSLADRYNDRAAQLDRSGFTRLATTLRDLANSYERDAKREVVNSSASDE